LVLLSSFQELPWTDARSQRGGYARIRFAHEQKILPHLIKREEVFAANTLNLE
jgi:hypothetical protein